MPSSVARLAIIGCGNMGATHLRELAPQPEVEIVAFADPRLEAAEKLRDELGAGYAVADPSRVFADPAVDAVVIATHHDLHCPLTLQAAEAGKHVFVEKPLAITAADCDAMVEAVERHGIKLMTGFQIRYSPFLLKLRELIPEPWVTIAQLIDPRWGDQSWANDPVAGGGNVLSQGCHLFDALYFLNQSEPVTVYAQGGNFHHPDHDIVDGVCCTVTFANGRIASAVIGDFGRPALLGKASYQLFAGDKTATLSRYYQDPILHCWNLDLEVMSVDDLPPEWRNDKGAHGYTQQMSAFARWIALDETPHGACFVQDGARATRMGLAAMASLRSGQPVTLG